MLKVFAVMAFILCLGQSALAQTSEVVSLNPDRKKPLEITADESLEWHRTEKYFKALKNVEAKQGDIHGACDQFDHLYRIECSIEGTGLCFR